MYLILNIKDVLLVDFKIRSQYFYGVKHVGQLL